MSTELKPGTRLFSIVCDAELIAVKAPTGAADITIGGYPARTDAPEAGGSDTVLDGHGGGTAMGKRYVDDADTVELLCTKAGDGVPALNGEVLHIKEAKPLPASD